MFALFYNFFCKEKATRGSGFKLYIPREAQVSNYICHVIDFISAVKLFGILPNKSKQMRNVPFLVLSDEMQVWNRVTTTHLKRAVSHRVVTEFAESVPFFERLNSKFTK